MMVGSLVAAGATIVDWLARQDRPLFYYDIDAPITLERLSDGGATDYVRADQIPMFETCFSFTGGPALEELEQRWGARRAEALYCGVDPAIYRPVSTDAPYECLLSYAGTYAVDRQPSVEEMLLAPATMRKYGWSPSTRMFEAAASGACDHSYTRRADQVEQAFDRTLSSRMGEKLWASAS